MADTQKKVYIAGHCLTKGSQMQRDIENKEVKARGHLTYNPKDNKEINDKATAKQEGLAERIVKHDLEAIRWADTVIIEPLPEAQGTIAELGIIFGRKDLASQILDIYRDRSQGMSAEKALFQIGNLCHQVTEQKVYPHFEDIRRFPGVTESEDRRSLGINQFIYGMCLDMTDGKGFYEEEEIYDELA